MEDGNLISKKDLLQTYGISYGALYRWKRKGLIPEDWFIRKATPTGQETFFPAALITERVEAIMNGKNDFELDELAKKLRGEEDDAWVLTVSTAYGDRSFRLRDVRGVRLTKGSVTLDVTKHVTSAKKEEESWI
ncbi:MAG: DUF4004 family protein [Clostridia bacterium]|nr:DUF4004 family protein [Clostridia bacterium]